MVSASTGCAMNKSPHKLPNMRSSPRLSAERWTRRYSEPVPVVIDPETGEQELGVRDVDVPGCLVRDHDAGLIYRLTIDEERAGGAAITFLSVETTGPGQSVPARTLPHSQLIRLAREVLAEQRQRPALHDRRVTVAGVKPPLDVLARDYGEHNRDALASRYGVSPSTVDRWLSEARRTPNPATGRPYLARRPPGRPPKNPTTPDGDRRSGKPNQ